MSSRPLPPLNALRAFEAAGRLGSFLAAASELNVTPGAISRHIALLEESLQAPLFSRRARGVELTIEGRAYLHDVQPSFERIALATLRRRQHSGRYVLKLDSSASFALRWLVPRLQDFRRRYPDIELHLSTRNGQIEEEEQDVQLMIRTGPDVLKGFETRPFLANWRLPVCSPRMIGRDLLREPADLSRFTILFADTLTSAWTDWLGLTDSPELIASHSVHFDRVHLAIEAAEQGIGIALPSYALVERALAEGRLVAPFADIRFPARDYCAYVSQRRLHHPGVQELLQWLSEQGSTGRPA